MGDGQGEGQRDGQRVVVVTGAAGGIGAGIREEFERRGDHVVGLDLVDGFDVTDPARCDDAVAAVMADRGRLDVLCNNAGISAVGDVVASTPEQWEAVFAVNVFGVANMSRSALPAMRVAGRGAIVNTCSVAALVGLVDRAVYSASKGAVLALTKAMAADEIAHGIRVNCVCPGTVDSPWVRRLLDGAADPDGTRAGLEARQPMGRMVGIDEVAAAVAWLADDRNFTTGNELVLDGGITGVRIVDAAP